MSWWNTKQLKDLNSIEWEALCDGCGLCCLHKSQVENESTIYYSPVSCRLLGKNCQCSDYANRKSIVPDCAILSLALLEEAQNWLPLTCAYLLRYHNMPLPQWHYLVTGNRQDVHEAGISARETYINETEATDYDFDGVVLVRSMQEKPKL